MDNVDSFAAGVLLGLLIMAAKDVWVGAKRLDQMDEAWMKEQEKMRRRDA